MGIGDLRPEDVTLFVDEDAAIAVDTGSRFVALGADDLERILDRLAAGGGTLRLVGATPRADDGDEPPDRESDPAMTAASWVIGMANARGLSVVRDEG